jgi:hypothetical protein
VLPVDTGLQGSGAGRIATAQLKVRRHLPVPPGDVHVDIFTVSKEVVTIFVVIIIATFEPDGAADFTDRRFGLSFDDQTAAGIHVEAVVVFIAPVVLDETAGIMEVEQAGANLRRDRHLRHRRR